MADRQTVTDTRADAHAAVEGLANRLGVPFVNTDTTSMNGQPDGAIGVIFPGLGRAVIVYARDGSYDQFWNGSGKIDTVIVRCRFAVECLKFNKGKGN